MSLRRALRHLGDDGVAVVAVPAVAVAAVLGAGVTGMPATPSETVEAARKHISAGRKGQTNSIENQIIVPSA